MIMDKHSIEILSGQAQGPAPTRVMKSSLARHAPHYGINPLIDHAAVLFRWIDSASKDLHHKQPIILYKEAEQILQAIHDQYIQLSYSKDLTVSAHFCLCATLDELVLSHLPGAEHSFSVLYFFHQEKNGDEKFFHLLDHIIRDPKQYGDLIELMYLCMLFGFKGHYQHSLFTLNQHRQLCHDLYTLIRQLKGDLSSILSPHIVAALPRPNSTRHMRKKISYKHYLFTSIATVIAAILIALTFHLIFSGITSTMNAGDTSSYETHRA
jgi:type VI secretion system protein ImpK